MINYWQAMRPQKKESEGVVEGVMRALRSKHFLVASWGKAMFMPFAEAAQMSGLEALVMSRAA